ncbi:hypothetical protein [Tautonia marina]|uniref:hypothetical protein n=1 Tax=Tautonia marina TaxID=2653855 RepID=UPI0012608FF2|nr:hypothetical protein [Tautonia marina]
MILPTLNTTLRVLALATVVAFMAPSPAQAGGFASQVAKKVEKNARKSIAAGEKRFRKGAAKAETRVRKGAAKAETRVRKGAAKAEKRLRKAWEGKLRRPICRF